MHTGHNDAGKQKSSKTRQHEAAAAALNAAVKEQLAPRACSEPLHDPAPHNDDSDMLEHGS